MTIKELKIEVANAIQNQCGLIESLSGTDNPQTIIALKRHENIQEALEAVLAAINGNKVMLKLL
jgi:hypothetical protein